MMNRTSWQSLLDVAQPLDEVFHQEWKDPSIDLSKVFTVRDMDSAEVKHLNSYGVGDLEDVGEGGQVPYDDPGEGYPTIYAYRVFKKGVQVTEELADDDHYHIVAERTKDLAQRASYTPLSYAYKLFQNAFTANPTGYGNYNAGTLAMCSSAQTYENGDAGTQSNTATYKLTADNFDLAMTALHTQKTGHGTLIELVGKPLLMVGPSKIKIAREITESELNPATANNAINVYQGSVADVVVNPWLHTTGGAASNEYWFLIAKEAKLNFFFRKGYRALYDQETDFDTHVLKSQVIVKYVAGFSDWRGIWGSTGAA